MAYRCILHLKNECDGCGACEERFPDEEEYDPFEIDYDDER